MTASTKTYRATTLTDALAQVRAELGPDAVVVRRREGLHGGVAGFFQKSVVEIEAHSGAGIDLRDDDAPAMPDVAPAMPDVAPTLTREAATVGFAAALATATRNPEPRPYANPAIDAIPMARDSAPEVGPSMTALTAAAPDPAPSFVAEPLAAPAAPPAPHPAAPPATHPEVDRVVHALRRAGITPAFADELVAEATDHGLPFADDEHAAALRPLVVRALARRLAVAPLRGPGAVAVIGAGGSGKTAVVARLATAYAAAGRLPVAVIALRPKDGGAELARLLAPAGVPLSATDDVDGAGARIANLRRAALVLVDTPALPPRAGSERDALVADLNRLDLDEVHLALPAVLAGEVARDLLESARELGASRLAVTHADATARLGMALELAAEARTPVSYLADTATVRPAAAEDLAFALLP
jgi:flagellar biosynthesis GTPase FlhF